MRRHFSTGDLRRKHFKLIDLSVTGHRPNICQTEAQIMQTAISIFKRLSASKSREISNGYCRGKLDKNKIEQNKKLCANFPLIAWSSRL